MSNGLSIGGMPTGALSDFFQNNSYKPTQPTNQSPTNTGIGLINAVAGLPGSVVSEENIDVIKDFSWTYSTNILKKIDEIPYIEAKEFKMAGNSYISSLMTLAQ